MPLTIHLPPEVEEKLHSWAERANESAEEIIRRALESYLSIPPDLREELEAWQQLGAEAIEKVAPNADEAW
jgi:predicted transcriptional regulator